MQAFNSLLHGRTQGECRRIPATSYLGTVDSVSRCLHDQGVILLLRQSTPIGRKRLLNEIRIDLQGALPDIPLDCASAASIEGARRMYVSKIARIYLAVEGAGIVICFGGPNLC